MTIKGREKCHWQEEHPNTDADGQVSWELRQFKNTRDIYKYEHDIYKFDEGLIPAGQYEFPFLFLLPQGLPSSAHYKSGTDAEGTIEFTCRAKFKADDHYDLAEFNNRCPIVVREAHSDHTSNVEDSSSFGECHLKVSLERDCYTSKDVMEVSVDINNSQSETKVDKVIMRLVNHIMLKSPDSSYKTAYTVLEKDFAGVEKGDRLENEVFEFDLSETKHHEHKHHFWSKQKLSQDEILHAEHIQPTTNGECVKISYELEVRCVIDSPDSELEGPVCRIPLVIRSPFLPSVSEVQTPENWNPTMHDQVKIFLPDCNY